MNRIIDKAIIFCGCAGLLAFCGGSFEPVCALLLAITAAALCQTLPNRAAVYAAEVVFIIGCVPLSCMSVFLPLVVYDISRDKHRWAAALTLVPLTAFFMSKGVLVCGILVMGALSALLQYRTTALRQKEDELKRLRDNDVELTDALRTKNKSLMEKQDYEVHLATLRERNRIAREIHDNVGHLLSRSLLQVGAMLALTDKEKQELQYLQLESVKETLNSAMNSIRESVHDLHDDSVDLKQAVREALSDMQKKYRVVSDIDASEGMPANVKLCFISTVKEAMSNIVKHSNATEVSVVIREHPALYQLCISDNGTDIKKNYGGMGLNNMRERTEALGGIMRTDTENGFRIFISVRKAD